MESSRIQKINSLLKEIVSEILLIMIDREHFSLLTVTRVITSKDISTAKVYISLPQNSFTSFQRWSKPRMYDIQKKVNERLALYRAPKIVFLEDATSEYVANIERILQKIKKDS